MGLVIAHLAFHLPDNLEPPATPLVASLMNVLNPRPHGDYLNIAGILAGSIKRRPQVQPRMTLGIRVASSCI